MGWTCFIPTKRTRKKEPAPQSMNSHPSNTRTNLLRLCAFGRRSGQGSGRAGFGGYWIWLIAFSLGMVRFWADCGPDGSDGRKPGFSQKRTSFIPPGFRADSLCTPNSDRSDLKLDTSSAPQLMYIPARKDEPFRC